MYAVLSPAKKLDFTSPQGKLKKTQPNFRQETSELISVASRLDVDGIKKLMKLSDRLAELNYGRFQAMQDESVEDSKQSVLAFKGDTYVGLQADAFDQDDLSFAQKHLGILSGLYGVLKPLDTIHPYRLEMGTKLENPAGKDLYSFWGDKIAKELNRRMKAFREPTLINLASNEYFKSVSLSVLKARVVTPVFHEIKDGKGKVVGLFAKRARGMMARYMIENRLVEPEALKDFGEGGYVFDASLSDDARWVFARPQP